MNLLGEKGNVNKLGRRCDGKEEIRQEGEGRQLD